MCLPPALTTHQLCCTLSDIVNSLDLPLVRTAAGQRTADGGFLAPSRPALSPWTSHSVAGPQWQVRQGQWTTVPLPMLLATVVSPAPPAPCRSLAYVCSKYPHNHCSKWCHAELRLLPPPPGVAGCAAASPSGFQVQDSAAELNAKKLHVPGALPSVVETKASPPGEGGVRRVSQGPASPSRQLTDLSVLLAGKVEGEEEEEDLGHTPRHPRRSPSVPGWCWVVMN